jgi:hypothetical protein
MHDYEKNTEGYYRINEWNTDWNNPEWNNRVEETIIRQNDDIENNTKVMRWIFPEGTYSPNQGGGQFEAPYNHHLDELYFSFNLKFKPGFEWVKGGKLPGVKGGEVPAPGDPDYPDDYGFSASHMWTSEGGLMFYTYHHDKPGLYGDGVVYNNFKFETGRWYNITMRIVLNTVSGSEGNYNGILEGYIDGKLYAQRTNLRFRNLGSIHIDKLKIYSFFGGGSDYKCIRDEWIDIDNFVVFTYNDEVEVPRGNVASSRSRKLILPDINNINNIPLPETPANVLASTLAHNSVLLSWNESDYASKYIIESSSSYSGPYDKIAEINSGSTSYTNSELLSNTTYYYRIEAINTKGTSDYSEIVSVKTNIDSLTMIPVAPNNFNVNLTENQINLSWRDNSDNENNFKLEYKWNKSSSFELLQLLDPNTQNYNYTRNEDDSIIVFRISALNNYGQSNKSDVSCLVHTGKSLDINTMPNIDPQTFEISMDNITTTIGDVIANDPDTGQSITYSLKSGNTNIFNINSSTGTLTFKKINSINEFKYQNYTVEVEVIDNASSPLSNSAVITVNITPKQNYIFIDPDNNNDLLEEGSYDHPFNSWQDVTWKEGFHYAQKRSTQTTEDKILVTANDITIEAYGTGESPLLKSTADDYALKFYEKNNILVKNIEIQAPDAISCLYFMGSACDNNTIENCKLTGSEYGLRIIEGKRFYIQYNVFENKSDGIYSIAEKNYIYYNIFKNNQIAINIVSVLSEAEVYNNVFYGNARGVSTSYATIKIYNNIFYLLDVGDKAINHSLDNLLSDHNIFYPEQDGFININNKSFNNLADIQQDMNIDLNSLIKDPLFVDIYNDNFTLNENSPAINKGINLGLNKDFFGYNVPYGNNPDIGLVELQNINLFTSVNDAIENISINVYPNPTSGFIQVKINDFNSQDVKLMIMNASGKIIYDYQLKPNYNNTFSIDISDYPAGIYYATIKNNKKDFVEKIVKL